jgi:predicted ATPase
LPEVLRAASDEASLLLALDDAQWADYESLGAIGAALRDLAGVPLAVIVCVRSRMSQPIIEEMRTRIGRELRGECVRLGPLDSDALEALAESALPDFSAGDRNRLVRRIAADSAGSPLLAAEILRAIAHGLDLGRASHAWPEAGRTLDDTMPSDLPDAVVASIRANFRRLSADAQAALSAAAVLGDRSSEELIGRATGLATDRLVEALDELEWQRWLVVDGRGYVFAARLVRDVVARDFLTAGQRDRFLRRARLEAKTT